MKIGTMAALVALALVPVGATTSCGPASDGGKGTVVARDKDRKSKCNLRGNCYRYQITVDLDPGYGKDSTGDVTEQVYNACQKGDRWPDCKGEGR